MKSRYLFGAVTLASISACAIDAVPQSPARFVELVEIDAGSALPLQQVTIWLPEGYDDSRERFPVLYMYDGQNLFDPSKTHYGKAWEVDDVLTTMVAEGKVEPHIVVGMWSQDEHRYRQYLPKPAVETATGDLAEQINAYAGARPIVSDIHLAWLVDTLKPRIDREYRTYAGPENTTIIGASMGGIMACYAAIERPDIFGRAGCVSSHWPIGNPEAGQEQRAQVTAIWDAWLAAKLGTARGQRIWMDHGTAELDAFYPPYQRAITTRFESAGWTRGQDFVAREFEGAVHDENAWRERLPDMLEFLWR